MHNKWRLTVPNERSIGNQPRVGVKGMASMGICSNKRGHMSFDRFISSIENSLEFNFQFVGNFPDTHINMYGCVLCSIDVLVWHWRWKPSLGSSLLWYCSALLCSIRLIIIVIIFPSRSHSSFHSLHFYPSLSLPFRSLGRTRVGFLMKTEAP